MDHGDIGEPRQVDDRRDVADEIETEIGEQRRIDRVRGHDLQQRVAIGRRLGDRVGRDVAAGTRLVLDDELLAQPLRQPLAHQARHDVGRPAGGKADDDARRLGRVGLRPRELRQGRHSGRARGQMHERAAGKFHGASSAAAASSRTCCPTGRAATTGYTRPVETVEDVNPPSPRLR